MHRNIAFFSPVLFGCLMAFYSARAQPFMVTYDFGLVTQSSGQTDPTPPPTAPGVSFGSFQSVGASLNASRPGAFAFGSQPVGGIHQENDFSQFTGSLSLNTYFEVTITPLTDTKLELDAIIFTTYRSHDGVRSYAVRSSLDNYGLNLPASIGPGGGGRGIGPDNEFRFLGDGDGGGVPQSGSAVTLGANFAELITPVTFRFYAWNAESSTGRFDIDDVIFTGRSVSIPEPSASPLVITALAIFQKARRRRG